jgi:SET domain-containing protein
MDIAIKKSKIHGKGIFAQKNFKKGEIVLKWNPKQLTKKEAENIKTNQKHYLYQEKNYYFLMQTPEKYVNRSCDANTKPKKLCDIAIRNIKKGEEITSDYKHPSFKCKCGAKNCVNKKE